MDKTMTDICDYLNNYFVKSRRDVKLTISGKTFSADYLQNGQYFRIVGSVFNDGVHKYPATDLVDETFEGSIWAMAVPQAVIALSSEIKSWQDKYGSYDSEAMSPFASESFGNYSYSKGTVSGSASGNPNSWQSAFASRLAPYRRLRGIV